LHNTIRFESASTADLRERTAETAEDAAIAASSEVQFVAAAVALAAIWK